MFQFVNHHSFLLVAIPAVLCMFYFLLRPPGSLLKQVLTLVLLVVVVVGYLLTRPGRQVASGADAESLLLERGRPLLLEIYSPY